MTEKIALKRLQATAVQFGWSISPTTIGAFGYRHFVAHRPKSDACLRVAFDDEGCIVGIQAFHDDDMHDVSLDQAVNYLIRGGR